VVLSELLSEINRVPVLCTGEKSQHSTEVRGTDRQTDGDVSITNYSTAAVARKNGF